MKVGKHTGMHVGTKGHPCPQTAAQAALRSWAGRGGPLGALRSLPSVPVAWPSLPWGGFPHGGASREQVPWAAPSLLKSITWGSAGDAVDVHR